MDRSNRESLCLLPINPPEIVILPTRSSKNPMYYPYRNKSFPPFISVIIIYCDTVDHHDVVVVVIRSTLSNWITEFPRITIVPIFVSSPSFSAFSRTIFRNASYPRSVPTTFRLPLRDNFNLLSCV